MSARKFRKDMVVQVAEIRESETVVRHVAYF